MDFVQRLDASKLLLAETLLSFGLSLFSSPPYNLPIFLFGTYVQENADAIQSLQTFTALLGASVLFDLVWIFKNEQSGLIRLMTIILTLLKIPTAFVFVNTVRERHLHTVGFGGFDSAGATVWSMPGGFTSNERSGYQTVDDERSRNNTNIRPASASTPTAHSTTQGPPGAYQV
ncbi:hypothetical protein AX14_006885 [Amanita brunnescens Koide BX004]|nr:hypothetical protein AX14_006885 [Amanita brunnescens Koide BX004]